MCRSWAWVDFVFREFLEFRAVFGEVNQGHFASPQFKLQNRLAAKDSDFAIALSEWRRAGASK